MQADDVDEHAERLSGWRQRYDQLTPGTFCGRLDEVTCKVAQVYRERTSQALRQRCEVWSDALWIGLTARLDGSRIEGRPVGPDGVMACGRAGHFELISPAGHDMLGVVVSRNELEHQASTQGMALAWPLVDESPWLAVGEARRREGLARLRAILSLASAAGAAHQRAEAARAALQQAMTVVQGARTTSSWSLPIMLAPLRDRTPVTWHDTLFSRTYLPTGDSSPKSCFATVWPSMQTARAPRTSASVNGSPSARLVQSRTSRNSGVVPWSDCT